MLIVKVDVIMNKKNKIIVSIVGITIVLLALLGITYAYYLTRIEGNTNTNSISITTADLSLEYFDGTTEILTSDTLLIPGEFDGDKDFTVTNNGNDDVTYIVVLEDVVNQMERTQDFEMSLSCSSSFSNNKCIGVENSFYPTINETLVENTITPGETHSYVLNLKYIETGVDQSVDMGKTLKGKINIYDSKDTFDLTGTVASFEDGDYVIVESEPKKSYINSDGKYKVVGLKPDNHKISIYGRNNTLKGEKTILVSKTDNTADVLIDDTTRTVFINIETISSSLVTSTPAIKDYNPFDIGTLAYNIYRNSKITTTGTKFSTTTITEPTTEVKINSYNLVPVESGNLTFGPSSYADDTWYFYSDFTKNETTGKFTLSGIDGCVFQDCYQDLVGKYLYSNAPYSISNYSYTSPTVSLLYKVVSATSSTITYTMSFFIPEDAENELTFTSDDYGISYYFRGYVQDNFVNFASMCWRIVRIEGDGSVRLILEDKDNLCSQSDGNWDIGKGNFGYTTYPVGSLTTSDGRVNETYSRSFIDLKNPQTNATSSMPYSFKNFQTSKLSSYYSKLKPGNWCHDNTGYSDYNGLTPLSLQEVYDRKVLHQKVYYSTYIRKRNKQLSLKCPVETLEKYYDGTNMYVGGITSDELMFAGPGYATYLTNTYQRFYKIYYWSFSPGEYGTNGGTDVPIYISDGSHLNIANVAGRVSSTMAFRPMVSIKSDVLISGGNGTKDNPYVIE